MVALLGANGAGKTTHAADDLGPRPPDERAHRVRRSRSRAHLADAASAPGDRARSRRPRNLLRPDGRRALPARLPRRARSDEEAAYRYFPKLEELRTRRVGLLSGGEQQMLAVARGLARRPRLLLLDELSLGLAPVIVEGLLPVVHQLCDRLGLRRAARRAAHPARARDRGPRLRALPRGDRPLDRAEVLQGDRELLISSYLGEQQVAIGESAGGETASTRQNSTS